MMDPVRVTELSSQNSCHAVLTCVVFFKQDYLFPFYVYGYFVCVSTMYIPGALRDQKRALEPLELEL